jgi:uncharacterized protein (TIGR00725 family)
VVFQVAVCGPADCSEAERADAFAVGQLLAERGAVVICGGGDGVMAAAAAGARSRDGLVVGIRPDGNQPDGNRPNGGRGGAGNQGDLSVVIRTNLGEARNAVIVCSADAVIAIGGSWGTLSEVALARRRGGLPVISLGGWRVLDAAGAELPGIQHVTAPAEAVAAALLASSA